MTVQLECPSTELLQALQLGELEEGHSQQLFEHIDMCDACSSQMEKLDSLVDPVIKALQQSGEFSSITFLQGRKVAEESTPFPLSLPKEIGRYRILQEVGRGGMGVVYQAWDSTLKRHVAIKMILGGGHIHGQQLQRFRSESELIARLQHVHIVQIHEVGQYQELPFLVLEWVNHGTLSQFLHTQKPTYREATELMIQLADAVQFAHTQGIIHRDLKPANILLASQSHAKETLGPGNTLTTSDAQPLSELDNQSTCEPLGQFTPKITDFGLAKLVETEEHLTQTGQVMGTPSYLSPEQAQGSRLVGPATDIYSLGAILYELLSGQPPFVAPSPIETVMKVIQEDARPLTQINSQLSRDLITICQKCLYKDPARRYASAASLADDLRRFLRGEPIHARPVGKWEKVILWSQRKPALATAMAITVFSILVGSIVSIIFGISATAHANEAISQSVKANIAREKAEQEKIKVKRKSSALMLAQAQSIAEAGKVQQALFNMLDAWRESPADEKDFHQTIRANLHAWLAQAPKLVWQIRDKNLVFIAYANQGTEIITWTPGRLERRDAITSRLLGTVPFDQIKQPIVLGTSVANDLVAMKEMKSDDKSMVCLVLDLKTLKPVHQPFRVEIDSPSLLKVEFTQVPEHLVVKTVKPVEKKQKACLRVWNYVKGEPVGKEIIAPLASSLDPVVLPSGQLGILVLEPSGKEYCVDIQSDLTIPVDWKTIRTASHSSPGINHFHGEALGNRPVINHRTIDGVASWILKRGMNYSRLELTNDGHFGLLRESSNSVRFYDTSSKQPSLLALTHPQIIDSVYLHPTTQYVTILTSSDTFSSYQLPSPLDGTVMPTLRTENPRGINSRCYRIGSFSETANRALLTLNNGKREMSRLMDPQLRTIYHEPIMDVTSHACWSRDGRLLALATPHELTPIVKVYNTATGKLLFAPFVMPQYVHSLTLSAKGEMLAVGLVAGTVLIDLKTGKMRANLIQPGPIFQAQFNQEETQLVALSRSGWNAKPGFQVWDLSTNQPVADLVPSKRAPVVRFDQNGRVQMVDLDKGTFIQFDAQCQPRNTIALERLTQKETFLEEYGFGNVIVDSTGTRLAVKTNDGSVGLWNLQSGTLINDFIEYNDAISKIVFSPTGRWLAVIVGEQRVRLLDIRTALPVGPWLNSPRPILDLQFSHDKQNLYVLDSTGLLKEWTLPGEEVQDVDWYQSKVEQHLGIRQRENQWQPFEGKFPIAEAGKSSNHSQAIRWHREHAFDSWRARLDRSALWHLHRWAELDKASVAPYLLKLEIALAKKDQALIKTCLEELTQRRQTEQSQKHVRFHEAEAVKE